MKHSMYEFQTVKHVFQTWKKITNWNEKKDKHSHKEVTYWNKRRCRISSMKNYHSSAILFTSRKSRNKLQWRALALESFPTNPFFSLYREYIYTILDLRLISETKPGNYFHSQSDTNSLECGTITMIYKY